MKSKILVFVYGTLMKGMRNHCVLEDVKGVFQSEAYTLAPWVLKHNGSYPALIESDEAKVTVQGELYLVPQEGLRYLDALEGYRGPDIKSNLYNRKLIKVVANHEIKEVSAYIYNSSRNSSMCYTCDTGNFRDTIGDECKA